MYFFDLKALRRDLVAGKESDADLAPYLFVVFFFYVVNDSLDGLINPKLEVKAGAVEWTFAALSFAVSLVGFIFCYQKNGGGQGRAFLNRFLPLAWVIGWRLLRVALPIAIVVLILDRGLAPALKDYYMNLELQIAGVLANAIFYGWISFELRSIRQLSGP